MKPINQPPTATPRPHVRWMIRADMPRVLEIAAASFSDPWGEEDFLKCLRQRNCIGNVVELGCDLAGYMIYELRKGYFWIATLAVDPEMRRRGVGTAMVQKLIGKLDASTRNYVRTISPASHLEVHQFLRSCGFKARKFSRSWRWLREDGIYFEAKAAAAPEAHKGYSRPPAAESAE